VWHIPWEVYWGFMYRIVCETGSALRSTLPPRLYLDRDVKNQVLSSWLKRKRSDMNEGQTKDYETTARLCAVSGSCLVQLPRSFIDSFIKGSTNLRVEYNEGQSVSVCSVYSATTSLFPSAASLQSLYTLFHCYTLLVQWLKGILRPRKKERKNERYIITALQHQSFVLLNSREGWRGQWWLC